MSSVLNYPHGQKKGMNLLVLVLFIIIVTIIFIIIIINEH